MGARALPLPRPAGDTAGISTFEATGRSALPAVFSERDGRSVGKPPGRRHGPGIRMLEIVGSTPTRGTYPIFDPTEGHLAVPLIFCCVALMPYLQQICKGLNRVI